jgi:hypothetical protein
MLETVLFFAVVSIVTEVLLMMQMPKWLRKSKWFAPLALLITLAVTLLNLYLGMGTVTGTLTAKLAFVGGFAAAPLVMWWDSVELPTVSQLRLRAYNLVK